ncbi:MAG: hypothetical protein WB679_07210 [Terracidiphilus sp.]
MTTNAATPLATPGKTAGASFLDILLMDSGTDFLGVKASSGSGAQTGSEGQSYSTQSQGENSQAPAFQHALDTGVSSVSSPVGTNPAQDQSNGQQASQSLANGAAAVTSQILEALLPPARLDAAQLGLAPQTAAQPAAQPVSQPTGKAGKQQALPTTGTVVDPSIGAAILSAPLQETPLPLVTAAPLTFSPAKQIINSQIPASSAPSVEALISGTVPTGPAQAGQSQTVTTHDGQQPVDASQPANAKAQQDATPQSIANVAQTLQNSFATVLTAPVQAYPSSPSANSAAGTVADGSATAGSGTSSVDSSASPAQGSNPQSSRATNLPAASTFLSAVILPNNMDADLLGGKANQFKTSATTFNTSSSLSGLSGAATTTSTAKATSQDSQGASSHNAQNGSDPAQHGPTDASQTNPVAAKANDNGTSQPIAFATVAATHQAATVHTATDSTDSTPHRSDESANLLSEQMNAAGNGATSGINTARLIQSMSETEMRVGMHSTEFGDISIRTMVSQQQMQAQISVDHSELSNAISAHIPSIQTKLDNQYGLHASIEVSHGGASFSGERGQSSQKDQRAFIPSAQLEGTAPASETDRMVLRVPSIAVVSDRLDIRA